VPENLLTLLNYLLIALLYLFFARVVWAVWSEVKATKPKEAPVVATPQAPPTAAPSRSAKRDRKADARSGGRATRLVVKEPAERAGTSYGMTDEMTVGRASGCRIALPGDTFASNLHARIYVADGLAFVEDLGSTNGTFVNGARISGPTAVRPGDRIQVGATVLEAE
jgi:pSer/pThr/pTyr-binding forkhead associated (FHA) protein